MAKALSTTILGRTELPVTRLGYGAGAVRDLDGEHAETILNAVLDAGINFIDTSIDYDMSEEFIGKYISHRRSEFYLASKCGCSVLPEAIAQGGYVNRCVNDIRRRPSQPLIQWRFHPHTVHRDRRLRSTQGPSDA